MDIFRIYMERAVEKCQRQNFWTPWKPKNSKNISVYSFAIHPVRCKKIKLGLKTGHSFVNISSISVLGWGKLESDFIKYSQFFLNYLTK